MVCSGDKTKLLVIGTRALRQRKLINQNKSVQVTVCDDIVEESEHEKLLGVVITNDLSWKGHLYGNGKSGKEKLTGLIPKLSQSVGILTKLGKIMTPSQFKNACEGIFYSKLNYCIQVFGHVWNIDRLAETNHRFPAFTKEDNRRLQTLQNKILRLKSGLDRSTPTRTLLTARGDLSVQQTSAYFTLMSVHRATTTNLELQSNNRAVRIVCKKN